MAFSAVWNARLLMVGVPRGGAANQVLEPRNTAARDNHADVCSFEAARSMVKGPPVGCYIVLTERRFRP